VRNRATPTIRRVRPSPWKKIRAKGFVGSLVALGARVSPPRVRDYQSLTREFAGLRGLEVGGPSQVFTKRGIFPIYEAVSRVDNVNFSFDTIWDSAFPGRPAGIQHVSEATELTGIPSASYDFVASSHTIEHTANPLKALREWKRVTRPGGYLVLVVPDKHRTFDRRRPITAMRHLEDDLERDTGEDDLTHVEESERLHDASRDPGETCSSVPLAQHNLETRVMHHHVFDVHLVRRMVEHTGFQLVALDVVRPCHIFALARRA